MAEKKSLSKTTTKSVTKKAVKDLTVTLPEKAILDTVTLDVGDVKLTEKEKLFVFWYTYPGDAHNENDAFQNQSKAARKAGYKSPVTTGYKLRNKENVSKAISLVLDKKLKIDLEEAYNKIFESKKIRAFFAVADFVEKRKKQIRTVTGDIDEVEVEDLKDLKDLTAEQRQVIDGIDYKGAQGIKVYTFANREKAQNDLLNIYAKVRQEEGGTGDFDVDFTYEAIQEKLTVKASIRKKKTAMAESVDFKDVGTSEIQEL